jgi:hypothetical protein
MQNSLMVKMRLPFVDNDLLYIEVLFKAGLSVLCVLGQYWCFDDVDYDNCKCLHDNVKYVLCRDTN